MTNNSFVTDSAKSWLRSKGVGGSITAAVLGIALTYQMSGEVSSVEAVELVGVVISAGIALWGRLSASKKIKLG